MWTRRTGGVRRGNATTPVQKSFMVAQSATQERKCRYPNRIPCPNGTLVMQMSKHQPVRRWGNAALPTKIPTNGRHHRGRQWWRRHEPRVTRTTLVYREQRRTRICQRTVIDNGTKWRTARLAHISHAHFRRYAWHWVYGRIPSRHNKQSR